MPPKQAATTLCIRGDRAARRTGRSIEIDGWERSARRSRWEQALRIRSGYMIWAKTYMNGAATGMIRLITPSRRAETRKDQLPVSGAPRAEGHGGIRLK